MASRGDSKIYPRLYRSETNRVIAGVAGGLGEYFKIDPIFIRVLFIITTIFGGFGLLIYLLLWLVIPTQSNPEGILHLRYHFDKVDSTKASQTSDDKTARRGSLGAILLITIGIIFLLVNLGLLPPNIWDYLFRFWPIILILLGLQMLFAKTILGNLLVMIVNILVVSLVTLYIIAQIDPSFNHWLQQLLPWLPTLPSTNNNYY